MLQSMRSAAKYIWWGVVLTFVIGFVFYGTSGLSGSTASLSSAVAKVNGETITVEQWQRAVQSQIEQAQKQAAGHSLSLDDEQRIKNDLFNSMVTDILLQQEYQKRGITVTDEEIQQAALQYPPPEFAQNPLFQTEGRFDPEKYRRYLSNPAAKQQGLYAYLEAYYRTEIPKQKLFDLVASTVYVTDAQLWRVWQDSHDSAQVSFVSWNPEMIPDSAVSVTDEEIKAYYDAHPKDFDDRPGHAVISVAILPRRITAADSAAVRKHAEALRAEILGGSSFEDVARRESVDSASAVKGGLLGPVTKDVNFDPAFKKALFSLKAGQISQPVLSQFGYHLIKADSIKGDTVTASHILLRIQQSDSSASRTDKLADSLAEIAAGSEISQRFDSAVAVLHLTAGKTQITEGDPAIFGGRMVPGASAWAFGGPKPGQIDDLIDAEDAYYLVRLDSLTPGGKLSLDAAHDEVKQIVVRQKKIDLLKTRAEPVASAVAGGKTLEEAAKAAGLAVQHTGSFTRTATVPGIGQLNAVVGAAFGLPVGSVSQPIATRDGVYVIRVDNRVNANRAAWEAQKDTQRQALLQRLRQQRVQEFVLGLRENAKIEDNRRQIERATQQQAAT